MTPQFLTLSAHLSLTLLLLTASGSSARARTKVYVLVDGDSFRAWTMDGPREHVPADTLPDHIARRVRRN